MKSFVPCRNCAKRSIKGLSGFYMEHGKAIECDCHIKWRETNILNIRIKSAGLRSDKHEFSYTGSKSLENYLKITKVADSPILFKDKMIYLFGPNGTQKSTIANWLGIELLKKGFSVKFIYMQSLIEDLTPNFDNQEELNKIYESYLNVDFLIVDESFDKSKNLLFKSGYQLGVIDRFLRERFELHSKSLIFISNVAVRDIVSQGFSVSIQNLIERNTTKVGSELQFVDNYYGSINSFDAKDIFAF